MPVSRPGRQGHGPERDPGWVRAVHCVILPIDAAAGERWYARARAISRFWAAAPYGGWPADADPDAGTWEPQPDVEVRWRSATSGQRRVWFLRRTEPGRDPDQIVITAVTVGDDGDRSFVGIEQHEAASTGILAPSVGARRPPPTVVAALVDGLATLDARHQVTTRPELISDTSGVTSLSRLCTHPARRLPVVAITGAHHIGGPAGAEQFARELAGLAHVVVCGPGVAAELAPVGYLDVPPDVAAAVWWPGWSPGDKALCTTRLHHELGPTQWGTPGDAIIREISGAATLRLLIPPLFALVERDAMRERVLRSTEGDEETVELTEVLESYERDLLLHQEVLDRLVELTEENEQLRGDLAQIEGAFAVAVDRAVRRRQGVAGDAEERRGPRASTLSEAVELAARHCSDLVFLPEAVSSAAGWEYRDPTRVLDDLVILNELVGRWADQPDLGRRFATMALEAGLPWRSGISRTARLRFRSDYERRYDGRTILLGPHLAWGAGHAAGDALCRAYVDLDGTTRRCVVGHIGSHLRGAGDT